MTDINLKTLTPDTSLPTTGFLFGADSQASTNPSVYSTQTVATTLLGSTSLTGDTLTGSSSPVLDLAQTWNNSGTTFTGVRFNAAGSSSANSASGSLLMDLQTGGNSRFKVGRDGTSFIGNAATYGNNFTSTGSIQGVYGGGLRSSLSLQAGTGNDVAINFGGANASFSIAGTLGTTVFTPMANGVLKLGSPDAASPVAQTLSVQSIVGGVSTDASAAAYPFTITGAQGTGQGAGGSIVFKVAPAAGSSSNAQNALVNALTIGSDKSVLFASSGTVSSNTIGIGAANTGLYSTGASVIDMALGGSRMFSFQADVMYLFSNTGRIVFGASFDAFFRRTGQGTFAIGLNASSSSGTLALGVTSMTPSATLPATPTAGMIVAVNSATTPIIGSALTLGGSAYALAFYNNAQWTVIGN